MTLKEKFKKWLDTNPRLQIREVQLEIIVDEFAIGFLGWFKKQVFLHCEWSVFDLSEKEILEIYKKEKGL